MSEKILSVLHRQRQRSIKCRARNRFIIFPTTGAGENQDEKQGGGSCGQFNVACPTPVSAGRRESLFKWFCLRPQREGLPLIDTGKGGLIL
jgi:hypothetical protein